MRKEKERSFSKKAAFLLSFGSFLLVLAVVNVHFARNYRSFEPFSSILNPTKQVRHVLQHKSTGYQVFEAGQEHKRQALGQAGDALNKEGQTGNRTAATEIGNASAALQASIANPRKTQTDSGVISNPAQEAAAEFPSARQSAKIVENGSGEQTNRPTLVVYVFQNSGQESVDNFEYFLRHGLFESADTTFVIVLQQFDTVKYTMPQLFSNVVVSPYDGGCKAPWGVYAWALQQYDQPSFEHYIFLTSAVQGPFLPSYAKGNLWTRILTSRLSDTVKVVGPIISCQAVPLSGDLSGQWRQVPHVTQEMLAMDKTALKVLHDAGSILKCYDNPYDAKFHSESGSSLALLSAGYSIDCLMIRYQGVDWTNKTNWNCNRGVRPDADAMNDGATLTPLEVMFIAVNKGHLDNAFSSAQLARSYAAWAAQQDVTRNRYVEDPWTYQMPRIALANERGPGCFDTPYYVKHNSDLAKFKMSPFELWEHFVAYGQHQGRTHRWSCDMVVQHEYKTAYYKHRKDTCFDYNFYRDSNKDLKTMDNATLWAHFVGNGHGEGRPHRFDCEVDNLRVEK